MFQKTAGLRASIQRKLLNSPDLSQVLQLRHNDEYKLSS